MDKFITGAILRDMVLSGAHNIENHKQMINDLNVFPVPDGDTGVNMSLTIGAAAKALTGSADHTVTEVADLVASSVLKGARGNSGVILSILFRGIAKGLKGLETADGRQFAAAYRQGVEAAYKAVMKPSEGTILTVARVSCEKACEAAQEEDDFLTIFRLILAQAKETLQQTPEMLPVLKKANVVDAGGKGLITIFEGMLALLETGEIIAAEETAESAEKADFASFDPANITYFYCTEFIVNKEPTAIGQDSNKLRSFLQKMGASIVVAEDETFIKVHVPTTHPGKALEEALTYGALSNLKIENMKEQHQQMAETQKKEMPIAAPEKPFGFVAVAAGSGVASVFQELGVDVVVEGGQTMNPSTEDLLEAANATPAETVFILPNNKNIIMAAEMAVPLCIEKKLVVIPTKTIPQGMSAMLAFNEEQDTAQNVQNMLDGVASVKTGQVTFAVRDSEIDDRKIKKGEILALLENKVTFVEKNVERAVLKLLSSMVTEESSFITVFYGRDVTNKDAQNAKQAIEKRFGKQVEINLIDGGQPVYYYILSVE